MKKRLMALLLALILLISLGCTACSSRTTEPAQSENMGEWA